MGVYHGQTRVEFSLHPGCVANGIQTTSPACKGRVMHLSCAVLTGSDVHKQRSTSRPRDRKRFCAFLVSCGLLVAAPRPCGAQKPPASFDQPMQMSPDSQAKQARAVESGARTTIDAAHIYVLPELIDLAERGNPSTKAAWAQTRAQAAQLGSLEAIFTPR